MPPLPSLTFKLIGGHRWVVDFNTRTEKVRFTPVGLDGLETAPADDRSQQEFATYGEGLEALQAQAAGQLQLVPAYVVTHYTDELIVRTGMLVDVEVRTPGVLVTREHGTLRNLNIAGLAAGPLPAVLALRGSTYLVLATPAIDAAVATRDRLKSEANAELRAELGLPAGATANSYDDECGED